jgi:hypothetical protein
MRRWPRPFHFESSMRLSIDSMQRTTSVASSAHSSASKDAEHYVRLRRLINLERNLSRELGRSCAIEL